MQKSPRQQNSSKKVSDFRKRVLAVVAKIPKGQVMTYAVVAKKAGNAKASRAVGFYMSQNFDKNIPCHRVIRSDGKIGNYNRGGEKAKRALLKKEGAIL
ncbi:MAG TPA: MGMT family protein [Candidatus Paceibacterota bacterium]|nr:MGMT family protein [Candidatus Paceibacterota bacterium]